MTGTAMAVRFEDLTPVPGKCNGKARHGGLCGKSAGWGVEGTREGRCRLHRGRPIEHGIYSSIVKRSDRIAALLEEHSKNPDPLNTHPELALTRALLQDWVERYSEVMPALLSWHQGDGDRPGAGTVPDITEVVRLVSEISKGAKRERDSLNANWISRKDLGRLVFEMLEVLRLHSPDDDHYDAVREGFRALAVK